MKNFNYNQGYDFNESFDFFKHEIVKEIQFFNSLNQQDYMLEKKIEEMNRYFKPKDLPSLTELKNTFWTFHNHDDLNGSLEQLRNIKPCLIPGDENWVKCRRLISSAEYSSGIGRGLRYFVVDDNTDKILGLIEVKSDFSSIKSRDELIGWNGDLKNQQNKLNNIAILSTLIPVPDFGANGLGAKLITFLSLSDVIRDTWYTKYNDILEGTTTTSLFGHHINGSIYTGNKYFKSLKHTNGDVIYNLPLELYKTVKDIVSVEFQQEVESIMSGSNPKQRLMEFVLKKYDIDRKSAVHHQKRGIYWCSFYMETFDHLNDRNMEQYTPRFNYSVNEIFEEWLPKSLKRFEKLHRENRLTIKFKNYEELIHHI